ncbi:MAG: nucleotidyltransferase family protein [Promethearchaeia archaeon]
MQITFLLEMLTKEKILDELKRLKPELEEKYKVKSIGLFGSYLNDDVSEKSDIDILVEFYKGADLFDYIGLNLFLEKTFNKKVDLVSKPALRDELRNYILKDVAYL